MTTPVWASCAAPPTPRGGRFAAARARADQLTAAARDAAPGSDAWAAGSVALSDLTAQHDALVGILADIEAIDVRHQVEAQNVDGGDGGAIAAVRDQVTAWVADEDAVLADLGGAPAQLTCRATPP